MSFEMSAWLASNHSLLFRMRCNRMDTSSSSAAFASDCVALGIVPGPRVEWPRIATEHSAGLEEESHGFAHGFARVCPWNELQLMLLIAGPESILCTAIKTCAS